MFCLRHPLSLQCKFHVLMIFSLTVSLCIFIFSEDNFDQKHTGTIHQTILKRSKHYDTRNMRAFEEKNLKHLNTLKRKPALSQYWQKVGSTIDLYVFSAYHQEKENLVLIIGIALRNTTVKCTCVFSTDSAKQVTVDGTLEILLEVNYTPSSTAFVRCPLKNVSKPHHVGLKVENITTYLQVIFASPRRYNFTVCVPCLHGPFKDPFRIIETVETDTIFGADYFLIYNHSTSPEVDRVLRYYEKKGRMKVIAWNIPKDDVWYLGQIAALQDCTYASKQQSKYLVLKDLDELIVPRIHNTWHELMGELDTESSKNASYIFRHVFFHINWKPDVEGFKERDAAKLLKIQSLVYVRRMTDIFVPMMRTKAIINPEHIIAAGIHYPLKMRRGYKYHVVDPNSALLQHYRYYDGFRGRTKDEFMRKFADVLIKNVNRTLCELGYRNINGTLHVA